MPDWAAEVRKQLAGLRLRPEREAEIAEELAQHLETIHAAKLVSGATMEQATDETLRELRDGEILAHELRRLELEERETIPAGGPGTQLSSDIVRDVRYGLRTLGKTPGFAVTAILTLALGIGGTAAVFSVIRALLLRPLPFPSAERLMTVRMHFLPQNLPRGPMSIPDFVEWRKQNRVFENVALFGRNGYRLKVGDETEFVMGCEVTADFFATLGLRAMLGRTFLPNEDNPASPLVVVLSERLWREHFAARPDIVGQDIVLEGKNYTITGVLAANEGLAFSGSDPALWAVMHVDPATPGGRFAYTGLGRLKPGVTEEQAQQELNALGRTIERARPQWYSHLTMPMQSLRESMVGDTRPALLMMLAAGALVLLIAGVNVANLLLSRATAREREMALRLTLGASRGRLLRQLLIESLLLASFGAGTGLFLAEAGIRLLGVSQQVGTNVAVLDGKVLGFTLALLLASGILFGLAPALQGSRVDLNGPLKEGGRSGSVNGARRRAHEVLVVSEIALSVMLLVGATLLLRSFRELQQAKLGYDTPPANVVKMGIWASATKYPDPVKLAGFQKEVLKRVREIPGVEAAAFSNSFPPVYWWGTNSFEIEGQQLAAGELNPAAFRIAISPEYFSLIGLPLLKGRSFNERDAPESVKVVIISESMEQRFFPKGDALGRHLRPGSGSDNPYEEIVGVVGDVKYAGIDSSDTLAYYSPAAQKPNVYTFLLTRTHAGASLIPTLRQEVRALDRDVVINQEGTLETAIAKSVVAPRVRTGLLVVFASMALALAAVGIYGVMAYSVEQRQHEIGVRLALGAERQDVLKMVVGEGVRLAGLGIALGIGGALALTWLMKAMMFGVTPRDPVTFTVVPVILVAVSLLACFLPALRASKIEPLVALRHE
jgi:putative ABC transport system permease protein